MTLTDALEKKRDAARAAPTVVNATGTRVEDAVRYIAKMPAAISGQGGHVATFNVARKLADFGLSEEDVYRVLVHDYNPRCEPAWSERELRHKASEAMDREVVHPMQERRAKTNGVSGVGNTGSEPPHDPHADAPDAPPDEWHDEKPPADSEERQKAMPLVTLGSLIVPALDRAERRRTREETPIPVPFAGWAESLGGGLWPGAHFVVSGTGLGKSQLTLQTALGAAKSKIPTAYVGLELDEVSIALRTVASEIGARWSSLYLGKCSQETLARAREAAPLLEGLPFYVDFGPPRGWPASRLHQLAESMRLSHPTGPMLIVLDYLQLVGDEPDAPRRGELRQRVADAAYVTRDVARRFETAVVVVSSAARNHYGLLASDVGEAGLTTAKLSGFAEPVRTISHPHVLIGLGKESGNLEFSADTVTVLVRWPRPLDNGERAILVAVPKVRAGFERWSALAFDGGRFVDLDVRSLDELPEPPTKAKGGRKPTVDDLRALIVDAVERLALRSKADVVDAVKKQRAKVYAEVTEMLKDGSLVVLDGVFRNSPKGGNT